MEVVKLGRMWRSITEAIDRISAVIANDGRQPDLTLVDHVLSIMIKVTSS